jgi:hypothetical protein
LEAFAARSALRRARRARRSVAPISGRRRAGAPVPSSRVQIRTRDAR